MRFVWVVLLLAFAAGVCGFVLKKEEAPLTGKYPLNLSEYGFFEGEIARQVPAGDVVPYRLNTPLFTDYAWKLRFVKLPKGQTVAYNDREVFQFPVGTVIIKTFYYPDDERQPNGKRRLLETRLLIHEAAGWVALPYHWNAEQTDARLEVAGGSTEVNWKDAQGKKRKLEYAFPNMNQCKSCHSLDGKMTPIGPSARQLNGEHAYDSGAENQLVHWENTGLLSGLPADHAAIPRVPDWDNPADGTTDERARAWLDINCAHCHNPRGPASTSGFYLDIHQQDMGVLGVNKTPVAAGRGSGDLDYDIVPGQPDKSILVYRLASTDPGIMMPEVGRRVVHEESLALIRKWIGEMK